MLLLGGGGVAWKLWGSSRLPQVQVITVAVPGSGRAADAAVLNASGYVTARRRATVSAEITGKLVEVNVEEGMPVAAGQVLARLNDTLYRATLDLAKSRSVAARQAVVETVANRELAELNLERAARLLADKVIGVADHDEARTRVKALMARESLERQQVGVAEAEVALRRAELGDTVVTAPFAGVVISKDAQEGEMVSPISAGGGFTRTGICTLVDMSSLEIEVDVNEAYIARVEPGQAVEAVLDAYPSWTMPARVITTIPAADRQKATVLVRIGFLDLDPRILPDMGVKVAFRRQAGEESQTPALPVIPRTALSSGGDQDVVFVVRDGMVERRAVRLGTALGQQVEVAAGVAPGEMLIVAGWEGLADGDQVETGAGEQR